jgi:methionyl-tRNA formyltransferase
MTATPHIAMLCATQRGLRCLQRVVELVPDARLTVLSFREEPWEPPFFEAIQDFAQRGGQAFYESRSLRSADLSANWSQAPPDIILAVSWRYMVPRSAHSLATRGAFVFHDSLLPAYRGFSPTVWAVLNNERQTGATLLEMAEEMDAGAIIDQVIIPIAGDEFIASIMERVTDAYLELLDHNLVKLLQGSVTGRAQDSSRATFCCKRLPEDARINWNLPITAVFNLIRASSRPYPGAFTTFEGRRVIVWSAQKIDRTNDWVGGVPGRVVKLIKGSGVHVMTATGPIMLSQVQLEGEDVTNADAVFKTLSCTLV